MRLGCQRAIVVAVPSMLGFSASASGLQALGASVSIWAGQMTRRYRGPFTERPTVPSVGPHPGRAPGTRGGLWSARALEDVKSAGNELWACTSPERFTQGHTLAVAGAPGSTFPWEAGAPCADGSVNTGNGDTLLKLQPPASTRRSAGRPDPWSAHRVARHNSLT